MADVGGTGRGRARRWRAYTLLGAVVLAQLVATWSRRWIQDDGFINIRIAQQVVAGNGAVYNVGERVEAFTSPLWLALLVAARAVTFGLVPYEWLAVVLGLVLALAGTVGLLCGAVWLWTPARTRTDAAWWLPLGILVPAALPSMWDFATSGLETGLAWGWIGTSFAAVSAAARRTALRQRVALLPSLALVGLGPLIRPELALYSIGLGAALLLLVEVPHRRAGGDRTPWWRLGLAWAGAPLAYQVFRMGYYATVVPNTALAKDAGDTHWDRGVGYLLNFAAPYRLVIPGLILVAVAAFAPPLRKRSGRIVALALVLPALAHSLFILATGGDYMHGRFWTIPVLALAAPLAAVPLPRGALTSRAPAARRVQLRVGAVALVALWAVACASSFRAVRLDHDGRSIDDQRALMTGPEADALGLGDHPVLLADQPYLTIVRGDEPTIRAAQDQFVWRRDLAGGSLDVYPRAPGAGTAVSYDAIGVAGAELGLDTTFVDPYGLADPVAARQPPVSSNRAGHTHQLGRPWRLARAGVTGQEGDADVAAATRAMGCGDLGRLLDDVQEPMTPGRFLSNLLHAPANTLLDIPADPAEAEARFCGS